MRKPPPNSAVRAKASDEKTQPIKSRAIKILRERLGALRFFIVVASAPPAVKAAVECYGGYEPRLAPPLTPCTWQSCRRAAHARACAAVATMKTSSPAQPAPLLSGGLAEPGAAGAAAAPEPAEAASTSGNMPTATVQDLAAVACRAAVSDALSEGTSRRF